MKISKAIFKYNNGRGALLCSKCSVIIKHGEDFTVQEHLAMQGKGKLEPQYCKNCKNDIKTKDNN